MASIALLVLLLRLSAVVLGQNTSSDAASSASSASGAASSASSLSSSASDASSSASVAQSSASSLSSASSTAAASSALSSASSLSSIASSASSVASSLSSVASSVSSVVSSASLSSITTSTSLMSSSDSTTTTAESSSSSIATLTSSSSSSHSTSGSDTSSSESLITSETASSTGSKTSSSEVVVTSTFSSVSFSSSTLASTSVIPTTSADGAVGYSTLTTYVVQSSAASTIISPYTTSQPAAAANSATTQPGSGFGGGGGLSTGAKAGIGAGVGVAVLAGAIFGGWYAWYMRRRRRRNSISASDRYPPSSIPSMMGIGGYGAVGGALGAGHMTEKTDDRSEMPSPPIGSHSPNGPSPPPRSPDRLMPPGMAGISSMTSGSRPHSDQSVSDYSGNEGRAPGSDAGGEAGSGYFQPAATGPVHEIGENERNQRAQSPQQAMGHQRTFSGGSVSQPSEHGAYTAGHRPSFSNTSQQYQSPQNQDGYWQDTQQHPSELQGSPGLPQGQIPAAGSPPRDGYRGVDPEVPLHQRISNDRPPPFRAGHLQKEQPPGGAGYGPSQNF